MTELEKKNEDTAAAPEIEGQVTKIPYPKSVFLIIVTEFCERFTFYGMRTVLVLYLSRQLDYSDDAATIIFHIFTMFLYFLCIFGAVLSDSWLGKFKTILYLSILYVFGTVTLTLGAIPPLNLPSRAFTMIALALIALGSGGIKPCVSAFGGDQFKLPEQVKQISTFFSMFYFSINLGSLISTTTTPILRADVHCFKEQECYPLAFGLPAVLMVTAIVIFVLGYPLYKIKPPAGNMLVLVSKTIGNAISTRCREKKTNPREHWLDYADAKYDKQLIEDVKVLMRVLFLYIPLPVFWALFDQQGSRWTFQATRMDGDMGSWDIKPDQMQMLNPFLILVLIPLYDVAFYPALSLIGIRRPLQKLTLGGILAGVAFIISGVVELQLEKTYPILPEANYAQLRIFNGENCTYTITTNAPDSKLLNILPLGYYENKYVPISNSGFNFEYTINPIDGGHCPPFGSGSFKMQDATAHSLFMSSKHSKDKLIWYEDHVAKPTRDSPLVRCLSNVQEGKTIKWINKKDNSLVYDEMAYDLNITEIEVGNFDILINDKKAHEVSLRMGGVYTVIINEHADETYSSNLIEITEPNSMHILWLVPQIVVMTLGEVMFSVTGIEFSYAQAPVNMKSVLQACWLLTVAIGNVIVVIVAELALFDSQASEFFLFAGLMFVDMLLFMIVAYYYKPNNPLAIAHSNESEEENSKKSKSDDDFDNKLDTEQK
uniref:Oligopeptide transporter 1 n=1 Tax=Glossina palpalis gambiensis TaxID=67801 RepID=A0A1B0AMQ9_9MUSC